MITVVFVILMTLAGSLGSFFLKKATDGELVGIIRNPNFYIGGTLYFISLVINVWLLTRLDYSLVVPLCSLSYVWTMILSCKFLKEKITYRKIWGTIVMILGIMMLI
ncbi:MAG: multidrug transporter [Ruminococcaceae bacterium]|nr:multidrug transporter [Oscillospiraceae bacterium]